MSDDVETSASEHAVAFKEGSAGRIAQVDCDDVYKEALGAPEHKIMLGAAEHKTVAVPSQRVVGPFFGHRCFRVEVLVRAVSSDSSVHAVLA